MENQETEAFQYIYSAKEQEEIKAIRKKYSAQEQAEDKMAQLRRLDASVTQKATTVAKCIFDAKCRSRVSTVNKTNSFV